MEMIEHDTVRLLREDDAGVAMGISAIDEVLDYVKDERLKDVLEKSKDEHNAMNEEIQNLLGRYNDDGKNLNPIAKGMSWMKTNVMLVMNESDATIADLITDGCNMGIKSLNKYLNEYEAADEKSKDITKKLIKIEEKLADSVKEYL